MPSRRRDRRRAGPHFFSRHRTSTSTAPVDLASARRLFRFGFACPPDPRRHLGPSFDAAAVVHA
ncbi:hypothetical protein DR62_06365 [Burkholderia thailandensis]|nr:hypothetical protein DR62_06365 [Burkholderia thailandensis]AOI52586.1 hypothetical protein WI24_12815 [Burkholderia thailandensis]AOJ51586.1 hypothetical protein AQ475_12730 [Burkholderia thailandensis]AOJ56122.1 hypothetical protein AQ477_06015 [Burkholderia thailandensis]AVR23924.1 hypothetical protein A8H32_01205 [Burkholderia thailandensis]